MSIVKCPVCGKEKETNSMMPVDCSECVMMTNTNNGIIFGKKKDVYPVKMTRINKEEKE